MKEQPVFDDRPTHREPIIVFSIDRCHPSVVDSGGIEPVVTKDLEAIAMERIRARCELIVDGTLR